MSIIAYAAYSKNDEIRFNSSSGGIFSELAYYVYKLNGIVAGAAFDKDYKSVSHILTDNSENLKKLTTSKYLQSSFTIHKDIESRLKEGRTVLCCGTPCQIAGLKTFLKKEYENLLTVDFICHGTPMQKVWEKYMNWQEEKHGDKVSYVNFRSKDNGWSNYLFVLLFGNNKEYKQTCDKDLYMRLFLNNMCLSNGCYECKFKGDNKFSDITIGDFWGVDSIAPEMNDEKGVSLVTINTEKGIKLFNAISENLIIKEVDERQAFSYNICALQPMQKPENYNDFCNDIDLLPFDNLAKKYIPKSSIKTRLKRYKIVKDGIKLKKRFLSK